MFRPLVAFLFLLVSPALAELKICNEMHDSVAVAIGYSQGDEWVSEGWWRIPKDGCETLIEGDLTNRYYYYRAEMDDGTGWGSQHYFFCTREDAFTITGDENCVARGYDRSEFNQIDTWDDPQHVLHLSMKLPEQVTVLQEEPGRYGSVVSLSGIFSHCDADDTGIVCEIHSEGERFVTGVRGLTDMALLEEMITLDTNVPITVRAELLSIYGITAELVVLDFQTGGEDRYAGNRKVMQGLWQSLDNPVYEMNIHGGVVTEFVDDSLTETSLMQFTEACPGVSGDGRALILKAFDVNRGERCFAMDDLGERMLLRGADGVVLRFRKQD